VINVFEKIVQFFKEDIKNCNPEKRAKTIKFLVNIIECVLFFISGIGFSELAGTLGISTYQLFLNPYFYIALLLLSFTTAILIVPFVIFKSEIFEDKSKLKKAILKCLKLCFICGFLNIGWLGFIAYLERINIDFILFSVSVTIVSILMFLFIFYMKFSIAAKEMLKKEAIKSKK